MSNELWIGLLAAAGTSFLFGTVFVPVRKVDAGDVGSLPDVLKFNAPDSKCTITKADSESAFHALSDGAHFLWKRHFDHSLLVILFHTAVAAATTVILGFSAQMFMCIGAFLGSTFIHALLGFPPLQAFAMIGGALWGIENAFVLQIMNRLGMALTALVCSTVACLTGWATSRYGLLGLPAVVPASIAMNYLGIILLVIGGVMYLFIKNNEQGSARVAEDNATNDDNEKREISISRVERALSFLAAMLSGSFIGSMWTPISYIRSHPEEFPSAPSDSISYQFSFYCGGLCIGVCVFIIYSLTMRNRPWFNPRGAVPAMLGGIIFAIGMSLFVIAIDNLDQAIAYPICAMAPNLVVSSWSIFYFEEITGRRNLIYLASAYGLTLAGVILIAISKEFSFV